MAWTRNTKARMNLIGSRSTVRGREDGCLGGSMSGLLDLVTECVRRRKAA